MTNAKKADETPWWLVPEPNEVFDEATRVRLPTKMLADLDRIEAHGRGQGLRYVTRSMLIRAAVARLITDAEEVAEL